MHSVLLRGVWLDNVKNLQYCRKYFDVISLDGVRLYAAFNA